MNTLKTFAAAAVLASATLALPAQASVEGNGMRLNGPFFNGLTLNGPLLQGIDLNGPLIQGIQLQGTALDAAAAGITIHKLTLPDGTDVDLRPASAAPARCELKDW